jgi:hypothetical protein
MRQASGVRCVQSSAILSLPIGQLPFKREACAGAFHLLLCLVALVIARHLQSPATCSRGGGVAPSVRVCISIGQQGIFKNSENGEPLVYGQQTTLKNLQMGATVLSKWWE